MQIHADSAGDRYVEINNVRVTLVLAKDRPQGKDWAGQAVLRVQAYKNAKGKAMHKGAELPAGEAKTILNFIEAVAQLGGK